MVQAKAVLVCLEGREVTLLWVEYHPPCNAYNDGEHRATAGSYNCHCGATSAWHHTTSVGDELLYRKEWVDDSPDDMDEVCNVHVEKEVMNKCRSTVRIAGWWLPIMCRLPKSHIHDEWGMHTGHQAWWRLPSGCKAVSWTKGIRE